MVIFSFVLWIIFVDLNLSFSEEPLPWKSVLTLNLLISLLFVYLK